MFVGWLAHSSDTRANHPLEAYYTTGGDLGKYTECFSPLAAVVDSGRLICIEDARRSLPVFCNKDFCDRSSGEPSKIIAEDLNSV